MTTILYFVEDKANCQVDGKLVWTGWQVLIVQESSVQKATWKYIMAWQEWTSKAAVLNEKTLEMGDLEPWCSWSQIRPSENHLKRARTTLDIRYLAFLLHSVWPPPSELCTNCRRHHDGGSSWFCHHLFVSIGKNNKWCIGKLNSSSRLYKQCGSLSLSEGLKDWVEECCWIFLIGKLWVLSDISLWEGCFSLVWW